MDHPVTIVMSNSVARLALAPAPLMELLRYDLAYMAPAAFSPSDPNGWDGWLRLLSRDGIFAAGLVPHVQRLLTKHGVRYVLVDERVRPDDELPLHSGFELRDYQRQLVDRALELGRGVIDAPPRSGKTRMAAAIIDANPVPYLCIAPTKGIVRQTVRALSQLPLGPSGVVGVVGGWPKSLKGRKALEAARVVVTTAATAVGAPGSFYATRQGLIIDEFHHAAATTYQDINLKAWPIYYRYGLTGTHFRSDENTEILMDAVLSDVIGSIPVADLVRDGHLNPVDFVIMPITGPLLGPCALDFAYRVGVVNHDLRNRWGAWAAQALMAQGRRVIVLVKIVDHGRKVAEMIPGATFVQGAGDAMSDDEVAAAIDGFNGGSIQCLVGTSVLGEGIDLPAADACVYLKGGSGSVTVTQDVFRVLTASSGKGRSIVVDFADRHHDGLLAQSIARGRLYAAEPAFGVHILDDASQLPSTLARL